MYTQDYSKVEESGDYSPIPEGDYKLRVSKIQKEQTTQNGDPMAVVVCEVADLGYFKGKKVYHNVVFFKPDNKAAGMTKHWLKVLGQAWESKVVFNPPAWVGKTFRAHVGLDSYVARDGTHKKKNVIERLWSVSDVAEAIGGAVTEEAKADNERVPF